MHDAVFAVAISISEPMLPSAVRRCPPALSVFAAPSVVKQPTWNSSCYYTSRTTMDGRFGWTGCVAHKSNTLTYH